MSVRDIIDYTSQDNASEAKNALYAAIYDKVHQHIEAKKQEIARNLVGQQEVEDDSVESTNVEQETAEVEDTE
jgi:hypothetical protein